MVQVKVLKFAGQTGLRKVGSVYLEKDERVSNLVSAGFISLVKEEKTEIETKEEKFVRQTKKRK
jgi:hypothetical protein